MPEKTGPSTTLSLTKNEVPPIILQFVEFTIPHVQDDRGCLFEIKYAINGAVQPNRAILDINKEELIKGIPGIENSTLAEHAQKLSSLIKGLILEYQFEWTQETQGKTT